MRQREFLRRLDAHLEHSNALMAQVTEEIQLSREELRLSRGERQDLRTFIREMVIRMERAAAQQAAELEDLREDSRAQRDALLRLIDRLGPSGSSA